MESQLSTILAVVGVGLLLGVTAGVIYLTLADWRDRRRQQDEARELRRSSPTKRR